MEISSLNSASNWYASKKIDSRNDRTKQLLPAVREQRAHLESQVSAMNTIAEVAKHRIKFTVRDDLDRIFIAMIDRNTQDIIKEIPPARLQNAYTRINEALDRILDDS